MYNEHFGIDEKPFSIAPDPRYLYMSTGHREAFAHLLYGIKGDGGFVLLTGEVGTGKTTVCRCLLEQRPDDCNIALILNPKVTALELLASICDELHISYPEENISIKVFVDAINKYLLEAHSKGRKTVLIIDEAQNLSTDVLEQIRLLTNLETNQRKLLQIIMLGQPELLEKLERPELRQLAQRITARFHLGSLSKKEVGPYIKHRLSVAGINEKIFPDPCIDKLFQLTDGIPRLINVLCDRALLGAYTQGNRNVDSATLQKSANEVLGKKKNISKSESSRQRMPVLLYTLAAVIVFAIVIQYPNIIPQSIHTPEINQSAAESNRNSQTSQIEPSFSQPEIKLPVFIAQPQSIDSEKTVVADNPSLGLPNELTGTGSMKLSFEKLFKLWGIKFRPNEKNYCQQAVAQGLNCLALQGGITDILRFNRPAMLQFISENNIIYYGTLHRIEGQSAIISIGSNLNTVPIQSIARRWTGDFTFLWKAPPGYTDSIRPGHSGKVIKWLDAQLAAIYNRKPSKAKNLVFEKHLVQEIKQFQFNEGLLPDGIAGAQTLIHINSASGSKIPLLYNRSNDA